MDKIPSVPTMDQMKQKAEETPQERQAKRVGNFNKVELTLPKHIGSRFNIPLIDSVSSWFGDKNPIAKEADPNKDAVWLLDNTAYRPVHIYPHAEQPWQAEFVACYFVKNSGKDLSEFVGKLQRISHDLFDKVGSSECPPEDRLKAEATIAARLQPIVTTIRPARFVNIQFPDGDVQKLGPGGRNAISSQTVGPMSEHANGDTIQTKPVPETLDPHGHMYTHFAEPEGWAVISDIDDSIKITMTPSPIGILRTTFIDDPTPIPGMPKLYQHIATTLSPTWFYLSASPYNLYPFLRPFLHTHYPKGTLILRDASWQDLSGFLESLIQGTAAYKESRMDKIHTWLPNRKILCVGDSTQSDPEAYGAIYRKYKGWIRAIFIRKVTDVAEMNATEKNSDARFEAAFKGVPRSVWTIFEDPNDLTQAVETLTTI